MTKNERTIVASTAFYEEMSKLPERELRAARGLHKHMDDFIDEALYLAIIDDIISTKFAGPLEHFIKNGRKAYGDLPGVAHPEIPDSVYGSGKTNPEPPSDQLRGDDIYTEHDLAGAGFDRKARVPRIVDDPENEFIPFIFQTKGGK